MTAKSNNKKILEKKLELRKELWPDLKQDDLWHHHGKDGFIPIPRVLPLVFLIMDDLASRPVSTTYFDLWCRKYDEQFVTLNRPAKEYAFYAGFSGQRGEQTWRERIQELSKLGFIRTEAGAAGPFTYILILNPVKVILQHAAKKTAGLRKEYVNTLLDRSNQVKAKGLNGATSAASLP
jgi:hypothetical protein